MIHVLMFSLDSALATQPDGDSRRRHLVYADNAGKLTIITYTPPGTGETIEASPSLTILANGSRHKLTFAFDALRLARQVVRAQPVDLLVVQEPFLTGLIGLWLRRQWRVPLLVQNHSSFFSSKAWLAEKPFRNRILAAIGRFVIARADVYRTVNQRERENYIAAGGDAERVVALALGTASAHFAEPPDPVALEAVRARLGLIPEHKVIIWVGYPSKAKRLPLLFKVFRHVLAAEPTARLLLVGNLSDSPDDLNALAHTDEIADYVLMPGSVVHHQLPLYYALASVYAHTSAYEGVPRVLIEASAAGLPLVALCAPGVDEVIEEAVNGYLVSESNPESMAARITDLLRNPTLAQQFGENARRTAYERYDADAYAENWVNLWRKAVALGIRP